MIFNKCVGVSSIYSRKRKDDSGSYHKLRFVDAKTFQWLEVFLTNEQMEKAKEMELAEGDLINIVINIYVGRNFALKIDLIDFTPVEIKV